MASINLFDRVAQLAAWYKERNGRADEECCWKGWTRPMVLSQIMGSLLGVTGESCDGHNHYHYLHVIPLFMTHLQSLLLIPQRAELDGQAVPTSKDDFALCCKRCVLLRVAPWGKVIIGPGFSYSITNGNIGINRIFQYFLHLLDLFALCVSITLLLRLMKIWGEE